MRTFTKFTLRTAKNIFFSARLQRNTHCICPNLALLMDGEDSVARPFGLGRQSGVDGGKGFFVKKTCRPVPGLMGSVQFYTRVLFGGRRAGDWWVRRLH
jgi:hypothetical protein